MKKFRSIRLLSSLLCMILLFCACSSGSENQSVDTGELTLGITVAVTETAVQTEAQTNPVPEITYSYDNSFVSDFTVLRMREEESLLAGADEKEPAFYERDVILSEKYGIRLCETVCEDILSVSDADYLSGDSSFDILSLNLLSAGVTLMLRGELQDLSEAGIDISSGSAFTYRELCEACAFGPRLYLLPFRGFSSAFESACVLCCNTENGTSKALYDAYKSGNYTVEKMMELVSVSEPFIGTTDAGLAASALLSASGFMIMQAGTSSPVVKSDVWSSKSSLFDSVSSVTVMLGEDADFSGVSIRKVSEVPSSACLVLPLPASEDDRDDRSASAVDPSTVTVLAALSGLVYGRKTAAAIDAIYRSSEKIIEEYSALPGMASREVSTYILRSLTTDPSVLFTWGDLHSLSVSTLLSGGTFTSFYSTQNMNYRIKVASASAEIYDQRLN